MSTGWNYSSLAHTAKLSGGPEKYVDRLIRYGVQEGVKKGHMDMIPAVVIAGVVGAGITYLGYKISQIVQPKDKVSEISIEDAKIAKSELLRELKAGNALSNSNAEKETEITQEQ